MNIPLLAGLVVVLITIFLCLAWRRPKSVQDEIKRRSVACKRCGAQIGIKNVKVDQEFSLRCETCEARAVYKTADLIVR
ncbi:DNA-directed RNA polymerase subunit RPC12/RpoP [Bradyrhizobium sp. CIR48]|nr:DNA-directed RNA polymerase subunit RPC12/RpoP [Bradyrhizobium sp. CIR18]MBB4429401.1 DNA-directed RNA polymerase subunit RPC12/RpoP [Bradyrhizobium sp. CIR48]